MPDISKSHAVYHCAHEWKIASKGTISDEGAGGRVTHYFRDLSGFSPYYRSQYYRVETPSTGKLRSHRGTQQSYGCFCLDCVDSRAMEGEDIGTVDVPAFFARYRRSGNPPTEELHARTSSVKVREDHMASGRRLISLRTARRGYQIHLQD